MKSQANVIQFPGTKKSANRPRGKKRVRNVDGVKYFNERQIKLLRRTVRDQAELHHQRGRTTGIREWMVIDLLTCTGLRVSEAANLRCGDIKVRYGESGIFVREGKGAVSGTVEIGQALLKHLKQYLRWKKARGESSGGA